MFIYLFSLFVCDLLGEGCVCVWWIVKKSSSSIIKEGSYPQIILLKCRCIFLINKTYVCMNLDLVVMEVEKNLVVLSFIQVCHVVMFYLGNMSGVRGRCVFVWGWWMDQVLNSHLFTPDAIWKADMPLTLVESSPTIHSKRMDDVWLSFEATSQMLTFCDYKLTKDSARLGIMHFPSPPPPPPPLVLKLEFSYNRVIIS